MKNKMVKRIISAALAVMMIAGTVGCGSADVATDPGDTSATTPETEVAESTPAEAGSEAEENEDGYTVLTDADGNVYDLGGMEVVICNWWSSGEEEEPANAYQEARADYLDWCEETYNFTIKEMGVSDWDHTPENFINYATSGGDENYVFTLWQGPALTAAMNSGLMYDLGKLDCLDFTEKRWQASGIHELFGTTNGEIYAMNPNTPEPRNGVYFNKRLLEEAGINPEDLYTWQESMEWTWDKFEEVCETVQRDTDNDGTIDIYAITTTNEQMIYGGVYSNDGEFIGKDETGYFNKLEANETMEGLNWATDMIARYLLPQPEGANWDYYIAEFLSGKAVFCVDDAYRGQNEMKTMEDDWGFVCFPMGPNGEDYNNCYKDNIFVIPACYDDQKAWNIAFAFNLFTAPVPGFEDYEGWKASYYTGFRDTESVDLSLARMVVNGTVPYYAMVPDLDILSDFVWVLGSPDESGEVATPAQKAESLRNSWQSYLDAANQ